ncbi:hypothetical protein [Kineosporia babensis]|uniref:Uncharacterized protein n=1 Tax=Kineosporia babensis TaxID=499548 RepID=A0A9X1SZA1_9ACTN|nr:hypothetical protein [Kineosporia babensis]MCD5311788.1 hypothetical protein [Kineosporia babensis]
MPAYRRIDWPDSGDVIRVRRYPKGQIAEVEPDVDATGLVRMHDRSSMGLSPVGDAQFDVEWERYGQQFWLSPSMLYISCKEFRARWDWELVTRSAANAYDRAHNAAADARFEVNRLTKRRNELREKLAVVQASLGAAEESLAELEAPLPELREAADRQREKSIQRMY